MAAAPSGPEQLLSAPAGEALTDYQWHFVKYDSNGAFVKIAAATDVPIGVLQNAPASGQLATVVAFGPTKISADGTLAAGDLIGTSADGQADKKIAGTDVTEYILGRVLETAAAGNIVAAVVNCISPARAA